MPTQRLRLNTTEDQAYRARLSRLEKLGIPVGCAVDSRHKPDRLTFEQTPYEFARIYELPSGEVAAVVPATMTVLRSGRGCSCRTCHDDGSEIRDFDHARRNDDTVGGLPARFMGSRGQPIL